MKISSITIHHLRNITQTSLSPASGVTVLCGDNAQGKTSALEAVYLVTNQKNLRSSSYDDVVQESTPFSKITLACEQNGRRFDHELRLVREGSRFKKSFTENGISRSRSKRELQSAAVFFGPAEMRLLSGPPSRRRAFLDTILTLTDSRYGRAYNAFEKILRQRNKHLKGLSLHDQPADQLLTIYDEQLARSAAYLWATRAALAPLLIPLVHDRLKIFWRGKPHQIPSVEYRPAMACEGQTEPMIIDKYQKMLLRHRVRELARGVTILGPQHDDLFCAQSGHEFAERASQGEMKAVVFALMSSQASIIESLTGASPVFLLDDIHAEFDFNYQKDIPLLCQGFQTIITTTVQPSADWNATVYDVSNGKFTLTREATHDK